MSRFISRWLVRAHNPFGERSAATLWRSTFHRFTPRLCTLEDRLPPAAFTVTNTLDSGPGSLRQAILDANALAGADDIVFDAVAFASPQTIALTTGQMTIADAVTITGPVAKVTIDAGQKSPIFRIDVAGQAARAVNVNGLALTGGNINDFGGAIFNNDEALNLSHCWISNSTGYGGGAIEIAAAAGSLSVSDSISSGNN